MAALDQQSMPLVAGLLQKILNPNHIQEAEQALTAQESQPNFSLILLHIVADSATYDAVNRQSAALYFKNFIKRSWSRSDGSHILPAEETELIKREIINLMLITPPNVRSQLGEAVSTIAESDFWENWPGLMTDLASRLQTSDPDTIEGILQVAHSIFKRWRPAYRSDPLYTEIKHVLDNFGNAFQQVVGQVDAAIEAHADNKKLLRKYVNVMSLIIKIFYDLACQDLPPMIEDNVASVSQLLNKYIAYHSPKLETDDEAEAGPLEFLKASIFETLRLYIEKYDDAFGATVPTCVTSCWNFLTSVGPEPKNDVLVSKALGFLQTVAGITHHSQSLFSSESIITEIVQRVIIPNLTLRESDVELFEDEPIEYIRRDLEGSDNHTRRRGATDLLRELVSHHDAMVTQIVTSQITNFLQQYASDPSTNWKQKDTAVYLFCSIAAKGQATDSQGVTTVNPLVDLADFFRVHVAQDFNASNPILQVDAIKFVYVFRGLLPAEIWHASFPMLIQRLGSDNYVIYTYAAIVVERALNIKGADKQPLIAKTDVVASADSLLQHLFSLVRANPNLAKLQENEFLMRCVMRMLIAGQKEGVQIVLDAALSNFIEIVSAIRQNPANPKFYYYLFEGIGALIKYAAPWNPNKLETALYQPFALILQENVQEFMPYVFQLFAALLESNPSGQLSEYYLGLLPPILVQELWESKGNVPALVRLLTSLISRASSSILDKDQLLPILGIFQKLLSAKHSEAYGFDLLESIFNTFPFAALQQHSVEIFRILLQRLDKTKTDVLGQRFARFYYFFSAKNGLGVDLFVSICDQVMNDVFRPVYTRQILPDTQKLTRFYDRKMAVVGLAKALTDAEAFVTRYPKGWALSCEALLKLLINHPTPSKTSDEIVEVDVEDPGFGVGFTQLRSCKKPLDDPYPEAVDVKTWVSAYLKEGDQRHGGRIGIFVAERLSEEQKAALGNILA